jgi:hypothetical protein
MSTETRPGMATERPRRPRKSETQAWNWVNALATAPSGKKALTDMMRWAWSVLDDIDEHRPKAADAARWEIARQLAVIIVRLPRVAYTHRAGLTEAEQRALLDPRGQRRGERQ